MGMSQELAATEHYGVATSLCILPAEESIKAIFILQQSIAPDEKISDFDKIFRSHKVKHEYLIELMKLMDLIRFQMMEQYLRYAPTRALRRMFAKKFPEFEKIHRDLIKHLKPLQEMHAILDWFKKANDLKNRGLYLDIQDKEWKVPKDIDAKAYQTALEYATEIYDYTKFSDHILTNPNIVKLLKNQ